MLALPAGSAVGFREDMNNFVEEAKTSLITVFESEEVLMEDCA